MIASSRLGVLAGAVTLACGPETGPEGGHPWEWFAPDRTWSVQATIIRPPPGAGSLDPAPLAGAATVLHRASFAHGSDTLELVTHEGTPLARWRARRSEDTLHVDWGSSRVPVTLATGWLAHPRHRGDAVPFAVRGAFDGFRVGSDYIEWTGVADVEVDPVTAEPLDAQLVPGILRFSAVPVSGPDMPAHPIGDGPFRFRTPGIVPRLDFFGPDADRPWAQRAARTIAIEAAPGLPPETVDALEEATRRIAVELEAAFEARGVQLPATGLLRVVPSRCGARALESEARERPHLAEGIRSRLCPNDEPLCLIDAERPERGRLEAACRWVAAQTWDPETGTSAFEWARPGDLRSHRADLLPEASPFSRVASTAIEPSGRILRFGLSIDAGSSDRRAERVAYWTERLLRPHPDDGPRPDELLSALEWASRGLQRGTREEANDAFLSRLRSRLDASPLPGPDAQRRRADAVERAAAQVWSAAAFARTSTALDARADRARHLARLARAGALPEDETDLGTLSLAIRFGTAGPEEAARRVRSLLHRQRWLAGLLLALGLAPNPAASSDPLNLDPNHEISASVTDELPLPLVTELVDLGPYDRAALRFAHAEQRREFARAVPPSDEIEAFVRDHGPRGLLAFLCRDLDCASPAEAIEVYEDRLWAPLDAPAGRAVPHGVCSPELAFSERSLTCRWGDWGVLPSFVAAWDVAAFRSEAWLHDPAPAWRRALATGRAAAAALDDFAARDALELPRARSAASALAQILNLVHETAVRPPAGPYCADGSRALRPCDPGEDPTLFVGRGFARLTHRERRIEEAVLRLSVAERDRAPAATFSSSELRQIAAAALTPPPGWAPGWCPDPFGHPERGLPAFPGVLDPVTGDPEPAAPCPDPHRLGGPDPAPALAPAFSLLVTLGPVREPTLAVRSPPDPDDCAVSVGGRTFGSARTDDPWSDLGCHALEILSRRGDRTAADALERGTRAVAE